MLQTLFAVRRNRPSGLNRKGCDWNRFNWPLNVRLFVSLIHLSEHVHFHWRQLPVCLLVECLLVEEYSLVDECSLDYAGSFKQLDSSQIEASACILCTSNTGPVYYVSFTVLCGMQLQKFILLPSRIRRLSSCGKPVAYKFVSNKIVNYEFVAQLTFNSSTNCKS